MKSIQEKDFEEVVLKSSKPVLVDFSASWCGPCRMLSPILEQVSSDAKGSFEVLKIDVDESYNVAKRYGIMSVPTMIVFKDGEIVEKVIGLRPKNDILETVKKHL